MSIGGWWSCVMEDFYNCMKEKGQVSKVEALMFAGKRWLEYDMDKMAIYAPEKYKKFAQPMEVKDFQRVISGAGASWTSELAAALTVPVGPLLMIARYHDLYHDHDAKNYKIISAEKGFGLKGEVVLGENELVVVYYVGKPDLVFYQPNLDVLAPMDHKTTDYIKYNFQAMWKPHPQTAGYIYAINAICKTLGYDRYVDRCIINGCGRQEGAVDRKSGKQRPRFARAFPTYTKGELEEWRQSVMDKVMRLKYALEFHKWIPRESACHLYAGCDFRRVCCQPREARPLVIQSDFQHVAAWEPYDPDEVE